MNTYQKAYLKIITEENKFNYLKSLINQAVKINPKNLKRINNLLKESLICEDTYNEYYDYGFPDTLQNFQLNTLGSLYELLDKLYNNNKINLNQKISEHLIIKIKNLIQNAIYENSILSTVKSNLYDETLTQKNNILTKITDEIKNSSPSSSFQTLNCYSTLNDDFKTKLSKYLSTYLSRHRIKNYSINNIFSDKFNTIIIDKPLSSIFLTYITGRINDNNNQSPSKEISNRFQNLTDYFLSYLSQDTLSCLFKINSQKNSLSTLYNNNTVQVFEPGNFASQYNVNVSEINSLIQLLYNFKLLNTQSGGRKW